MSGLWMVVPSMGLIAVIAVSGFIENTRASAATESTAAPLPFVSPMFGDNMVLQRGKGNTIWGWAKPAEMIRVEIAGEVATATAGEDGRWQAEIERPRRADLIRSRLMDHKVSSYRMFLLGMFGCAADSRTWNWDWG